MAHLIEIDIPEYGFLHGLEAEPIFGENEVRFVGYFKEGERNGNCARREVVINYNNLILDVALRQFILFLTSDHKTCGLTNFGFLGNRAEFTEAVARGLRSRSSGTYSIHSGPPPQELPHSWTFSMGEDDDRAALFLLGGCREGDLYFTVLCTDLLTNKESVYCMTLDEATRYFPTSIIMAAVKRHMQRVFEVVIPRHISCGVCSMFVAYGEGVECANGYDCRHGGWVHLDCYTSSSRHVPLNDSWVCDACRRR